MGEDGDGARSATAGTERERWHEAGRSSEHPLPWHIYPSGSPPLQQGCPRIWGWRQELGCGVWTGREVGLGQRAVVAWLQDAFGDTPLAATRWDQTPPSAPQTPFTPARLAFVPAVQQGWSITLTAVPKPTLRPQGWAHARHGIHHAKDPAVATPDTVPSPTGDGHSFCPTARAAARQRSIDGLEFTSIPGACLLLSPL